METDETKRAKLRISEVIDHHRARAQEFQARAMQCDHPITAAFLSGQAEQHAQWAKDIENLRGWSKESSVGRNIE